MVAKCLGQDKSYRTSVFSHTLTSHYYKRKYLLMLEIRVKERGREILSLLVHFLAAGMTSVELG